MRMLPTTLSLLSLVLVGGCAAAQSSSAAPRPEPDCSFRSPSTCWTVAGRYPPRRPQSASPKPDEVRELAPTVVASPCASWDTPTLTAQLQPE